MGPLMGDEAGAEDKAHCAVGALTGLPLLVGLLVLVKDDGQEKFFPISRQL